AARATLRLRARRYWLVPSPKSFIFKDLSSLADRELGLNSQRNNLSFLMTEAGENRVPPRLERLVIRPRGTESQREFVRERFPGPKRVIRLTPRPLGWA